MAASWDAFDANDSQGTYNRPSQPIWKFNLNDEGQKKQIHQWLVAEKNYLEERSIERFENIKRNMARYKGIQYLSQELPNRYTERDQNMVKATQKVVINLIKDYTNMKVSRLIKYRPGVAILPTNDEFEDKVGSKLCKYLLDNIWYQERFDGEYILNFVRTVHVMGEACCHVMWDAEAGGTHPEYEQYREAVNGGQKVVLKDAMGKEQKDASGNPIYVEREIKVGDVVYKTWLPLDYLFEEKDHWSKVDYVFHKEVMNLDDAKLKYGEQDALIADNTSQVYDYQRMIDRTLKNEVILWHFYHRDTKGIPGGRYICFTQRGIVRNKATNYKDRELPVTRLTDADYPGELYAHSFIDDIRGTVGAYNNLTNMTLRNALLVSHPKWVFPAGSVRKESLGNDITLVEFKGPQPPQLVVAQSTPSDVFNFRAQLKEETMQNAAISSIARGEPPPGIKAGVALQFLSEQEQERQNEMVMKFNEWILQTAIKTLMRASENYDSSDKRMLRILGKNNKWMSTFFDVKYLTKRYDIRLQNASSLPQSKAARMQTLLDLYEKFPGQITPEQVLDMLDFAQDEKFMNMQTRSVRSAEAENEQILEGVEEAPINDPQEYEDHITHWKIHVGAMREWNFKNQMLPQHQQAMKDHVLATEMLMVQKMQQSPTFMQQVMALDGFPLLYVPEIPMPGSMDEQTQMAAAQAPPPEAMPPEQGIGPGYAIAATEPQMPIEIPGDLNAPPAPPMSTEGPIEPTNAI